MKISILITTYERPKKCLTLLNDIVKNKGKNAIFVTIYNDFSKKDYSEVKKFLNENFKNNYIYIKKETNHAKKNYWKLIDEAYKLLSNQNFDYLIQLPDDVRLKTDFFNNAITQYNIIEDNKKICLNILNDENRFGKSSWTNTILKKVKFKSLNFFLSGWVDLCFIAEYKYLEMLNFTIYAIPSNKNRNKISSSGVGKQISKRLFNLNFSIYQVEFSLVKHGEHDSVMNPVLRKLNPLVSNHLKQIKSNINYENENIVINTHADHIGRIIQNSEKFYELGMLNYIKSLNKYGTYIDCGANIGNHTIFFDKFCFSRKVYAIEPVSSNFEILCDNIKANNLNKTTALKKALSLNAGEYSYTEKPENMGMCKLVKGSGIKSARLDGINFEGKIDILKIDCETMDFEILQSAENIIKKHRPDIFIECQTKTIFNQAKYFLQPIGYFPKKVFNATPTYHFMHDDEKITACMATIPSRKHVLAKVVNSIINQVDSLIIYLNDFEEIPIFLIDPKITVYKSQNEAGKLGDAGKFYKSGELNGYVLTIDDDLFYPPDYVKKIINKIKKYKSIVSFHGRVLKKQPIADYYSKSTTEFYRCLRDVIGDHNVHIGGTGVMGFHSSFININIKDFKVPNMADIWLAKLAQQQKIPIIVAEHKAGWIKHAPIDLSTTIASKRGKHHKIVTKIVNKINFKIMKTNKRIDVIIPFVKSHSGFDELKYAVRSIEQNLKEDFRLVIIGEAPEWLNLENKDVLFIPTKRNDTAAFTNCLDANNKMNKLLLNEDISSDFIITYDDIYFLKNTTKTDLETVYAKGDGNTTASSIWSKLLLQTCNHLKVKGKTQFNFETHTPRLINKKNMTEVYKTYRPIRHRLLHFTLYFNHFLSNKLPILLSHENKIKAGFYGTSDIHSLSNKGTVSDIQKRISGFKFLNHDDKGLSKNLEKLISKRFPNKSKFETEL